MTITRSGKKYSDEDIIMKDGKDVKKDKKKDESDESDREESNDSEDNEDESNTEDNESNTEESEEDENEEDIFEEYQDMDDEFKIKMTDDIDNNLDNIVILFKGNGIKDKFSTSSSSSTSNNKKRKFTSLFNSSKKKKKRTIDDDLFEVNKSYSTMLPKYNDLKPNKRRKRDEKEEKEEKISEIELKLNYRNLKQKIIDETITLKDIISLKSITNDERYRLLNKFLIMEKYKSMGYIIDYYTEHPKVYNLYKSYRDRDPSFHSKRLEIIDNKNKYDSKILSLNFDKDTIKYVYGRYLKSKELPSWDSDKLKIEQWLDIVIAIPHSLTSYGDRNMQTIHKLKESLDKKMYGIQPIKDEILALYYTKLTCPNSTNLNLSLQGSAGVGKTKLMSILAEVSNIPFDHISLGGVNDNSFLEGHSYTYVGSKPGRIVMSLLKMKCKNGMIFFDEIDKIGKTRNGDEVSDCLLHIIDNTQNHKFIDKYVGEIPIDLSKIWFTFSMNDENQINPILRNRLKIIKMPKYTNKDKIEISKRLLNEIAENINWKIDSFYLFSEDILKYILNNIQSEDGIRILKFRLENICMRLKLVYDIHNSNSSSEMKYNPLQNISFNFPQRIYPMILTEKEIDILMSNLNDVERIPMYIQNGIYT
jgi:ATP-dependent Lon protease